jgi:cyclohexyl-isocyanide hydratase
MSLDGANNIMSDIKIGIPLYKNFDSLDVMGAFQVFNVADGLAPKLLAETLDPVLSAEKVEIIPQGTFDKTDDLDVLFVPGGIQLGAVLNNQGPGQNPLLAFLRRIADRKPNPPMITSVCTGALFLAAAGLLDGYEATTHWNYKQVLRLFPKVTVVKGYPRWWDDRGRITGGGISSTIDEAFYIVQRLVGADAAQCAQLTIQYAPKPPFHDGDPCEADPDVYRKVSDRMQDPETTKAFQDWIAKWQTA